MWMQLVNKHKQDEIKYCIIAIYIYIYAVCMLKGTNLNTSSFIFQFNRNNNTTNMFNRVISTNKNDDDFMYVSTQMHAKRTMIPCINLTGQMPFTVIYIYTHTQIHQFKRVRERKSVCISIFNYIKRPISDCNDCNRGGDDYIYI